MKSVVSDPLKAAASTVAGRLAGRCAPLQKTIQAAENCYDDIFTRRNQLPQGHGGEDEQGTRVIQAMQQDVKSKFRTTAKVVTVVHSLARIMPANTPGQLPEQEPEAAAASKDEADTTADILRSVSEDTNYRNRSMSRARRQSVVKLIHKIDNQGGSAASLVSKQTEECLLHVRNIGPGGCKSVELLTEIFHRYGDVFSATIRDRVDKNTGQDSSWALVQMTDAAGASKALAAAANDRDEFGADTIAALDGVTRLRVTLFDKKRAVSSKGGMKHTAKVMLLTGTITSSAMKIVLFAHRIIMRAKR